MEKDLYKDIQMEYEALKKENSKLESLVSRLKQVIKDNELEDEISDINCTSLEEKICIDGIRHIASLVESQDYDDKDVKNFDTLFKVLRTLRGQSTGDSSKKKVKALDVPGLLKIVENGK